MKAQIGNDENKFSLHSLPVGIYAISLSKKVLQKTDPFWHNCKPKIIHACVLENSRI